MPTSRSEVTEEARPDMTPMIDAVFLLIVFFLCIDFRTLEAKLPANLPKDRGTAEQDTAPVEQLTIRIVCDEVGAKRPRRAGAPLVEPATGRANAFTLEGHRIHWTVGALRVDDADRLAQELERIAADPSTLVRDVDRPDELHLMPVVVEPGPDVTYGDVALTVDAVRSSGFEDLSFGGGGRRPR